MITIGCFSPSDEIKKSFDKVVNSLEKSNEYQSRKLVSLYDTISKYRTNNKYLATKADTIYLQTNNIVEIIETLRTELYTKDTLGDNVENPTSQLVNTKKGIQLYKELVRYHECAKQNLIDPSRRKSIDSLSINFPEKYTAEKWLEYNFQTTPTIAATTLLTKYQNDCIATGEILLLEIRNKIRK